MVKIIMYAIFALLFVFAVFAIMLILTFIPLKLFTQIGPTCGFYALVYGMSKVTEIKKRKVVRTIIIDSLNNGTSNIGEIFDVCIFEEIRKKFFKESNCMVGEISCVNDLDALLQNYYIVFPVLRLNTPHYVFLEGFKNNKYVYRDGMFAFKRCKNKQSLYGLHEELNNKNWYAWSIYYKHIPLIKRISGFILDICIYVTNYKLFTALKKVKKNKRDMLINKKSGLNMSNVVFCIHRGALNI